MSGEMSKYSKGKEIAFQPLLSEICIYWGDGNLGACHRKDQYGAGGHSDQW